MKILNIHQSSNVHPPAATVQGTLCLMGGLFFAFASYPSEATATAMAQVVAVYVGVGFLMSLYFDSQKGLHNLLRTDLLCLVGIYQLTLTEFLFPQPTFNAMVTIEQTKMALNIVLVGIGAMSISRHWVPPKAIRTPWLKLEDISSKATFRVLVAAGFLGYLYMFLAVQFNPVHLIEALIGPRFSEPWARGELGNWTTLLNELGLLSYVIPPLTGIIWNRRALFSAPQLAVVGVIFGFTLFYGFASGTRNIFVSYLATFLMGYLISLPKYTVKNTVLPILLAAVISTYASHHMLGFRNVGLKNYIINQGYVQTASIQTLAVDYNLVSIGKIADAMPKKHHFLGMEVLYWAIAKPIPRALWPGKPIGLSVSIESIVGASGMTIAATYLGESYMMGGMMGVISISLFFGALAAWWNRMAMQQQSDYALLVYALGFFAAGITMRSMFWLTTTILPVIALVVLRRFKFLGRV